MGPPSPPCGPARAEIVPCALANPSDQRTSFPPLPDVTASALMPAARPMNTAFAVCAPPCPSCVQTITQVAPLVRAGGRQGVGERVWVARVGWGGGGGAGAGGAEGVVARLRTREGGVAVGGDDGALVDDGAGAAGVIEVVAAGEEVLVRDGEGGREEAADVD